MDEALAKATAMIIRESIQPVQPVLLALPVREDGVPAFRSHYTLARETPEKVPQLMVQVARVDEDSRR